MATTTEGGINQQLLSELRNMYPEVPEYIVTCQMIKHKNNRNKVIEVLDNETPNFLYEGNSHNQVSHLNPSIPNRISNMTISQPSPETRQRSDSASSGISSTSTCSVSSVSSVPHSGTYSESRQTPTVDNEDFNQFVTGRTTNIPNINCDVSGKPNKQNLRPIQVLHVQTDRAPPSQPPVESSRQVLIQVNPRQPANNQHDQYTGSQTSPHYQHQSSYPGWQQSTGYNAYSRNPNYMNTGPPVQERYNLRGAVSPHGPPPPLPPHSTPLQTPNQGTSSYDGGSVHSSQATIFLRGNSNNYGNSNSNTDQNKHSGYNTNNTVNYNQLHSSQSDPYLMSSHYNAPNQHQGGGNSNFTTPLFIRVSSNQASDGSHYRFVTTSNDQVTPGGSGINSTSSANNRYTNVMLGPQGGVSNVTPSTTYLPVYMTDAHNTGGSGTTSQEGGMFIHYPQVSAPGACRVPGHPPAPPPPARTGSADSDHGYPDETRHISQATFPPMVSPASSHSSLSSDSASSQREHQRPRSGSQQEEAAYLQALLSFQRERMSKLKLDLESELRKLSKVRAEVNQMEKNMMDHQKTKNHNSFPRMTHYKYSSNHHRTIEDVAKLRDHNMKLQAEIQVMTREVDMYNNGQTPLGVLDPLEQQNFFKNMNTGQSGSIYSRPVPTPTRETPPPIPPRIHHVPPAPPPQPTTGSGDSDGDGEQWNCSACTFLNHPALNKCECCEMPRMNVAAPPTENYTYDREQFVESRTTANDFEIV